MHFNQIFLRDDIANCEPKSLFGYLKIKGERYEVYKFSYRTLN